MTRTIWRAWLAPFIVTLLLGTAGAAEDKTPPETCRTPRAAFESVFGWLAPGLNNPAKAARCIDRVGRSTREAREAAVRLKAVYEARALRVDPAKLPDEPGWVNPETGLRSLAPHPALPEVVVERQADGQWRFSRASLDAVDDLYDDSLIARRDFVQKLPPWLRAKAGGVEAWQALAILLIFVIGFVLRQLIRVVLRNRLAKFAEARGKQLAAEVVKVFATPGAALLGALMLRLAYPELGLPLVAASALSTTARGLVVFAVVLALYRLVDVLSTHLASQSSATESRLDNHFVPLIRKALKAVLIFVGLLIVLQNLEVNVASLLAGLGIGGLAVALAAKDTIANFFGSVMIFADRPFRVGDWISVEGVEGRIEEVGFRSTRIRTLADSLVTLSNARFMEAKIENFGARRHRRIQATVGITYDTDVARIRAFAQAIRAYLAASPHTRKDKIDVHFAGFGASSLDVFMHFYVTAATWSEELAIRHEIFLEVIRLAEALDVRFAFPTRTLHVESLAQLGARAESPEPLGSARLDEVLASFATPAK